MCTDWRRTHRSVLLYYFARNIPRHPFPIVWYEYGINACIARYKALGDAPPTAFFSLCCCCLFLSLSFSAFLFRTSFLRHIGNGYSAHVQVVSRRDLMFASVCTAIYYFIGFFAPQWLAHYADWIFVRVIHSIVITYLIFYAVPSVENYSIANHWYQFHRHLSKRSLRNLLKLFF